jgi:hypothetical protein
VRATGDSPSTEIRIFCSRSGRSLVDGGSPVRDGREAVGRSGCHSRESAGRRIAVRAAPACAGGEAESGGAELAGGDGARAAHPGDERARGPAYVQGSGGGSESAPARAALRSVRSSRARLRHEPWAPVAAPGTGCVHRAISSTDSGPR